MIEGSSKSRRDGLRQCYEQHGAALVAYAASILGDRSRAEDALQQVFFKLLRGKMELPEPAQPYLYRAVRNTALSMKRRSGYEVPLDDGGAGIRAREDGVAATSEGAAWFEATA